MPFICPECGAILPGNTTCQEIFETFLSLEYTDPGYYGAVHFLTVSCFMIQHGRYSDEALAWIQGVLQAYLEEKMTTGQIRQIASRGTSSNQRAWKIIRPTDVPPMPKITWSMTIADVTQNYTDAKSYCETVKLWAKVTLRELTAALKH